MHRQADSIISASDSTAAFERQPALIPCDGKGLGIRSSNMA